MEGSVCMHVRLKVTVGALYVYLNICLTNVIYKNTNNFFCAIYIQTIPLLFKILEFYVKAMFFFFGLCYYIFICLKWPTMKIQTFCTVAFATIDLLQQVLKLYIYIYKDCCKKYLFSGIYFFNVNKES